MKIYTKSGDRGQTSLLFGQRVSKNHLRVEAYGTVDEASSMIGLALAQMPEHTDLEAVRETLVTTQQVLFHIGAELATPSGRRPGWEASDAHVLTLEHAIDSLEAGMPPLTSFVLPGGSPSGAALHVARTVARRAERLAVTLQGEEALNPVVVPYLNRLSDYLFEAARFVNFKLGVPEPKGPVPQGLKAAAREAGEIDADS